VAVAVLAAVVLSGGSDDPAPRRDRAVPEPPQAAFTVGAPVPLAGARHETRWAPVRRAVAARARPGGEVIARVGRRTPEGTTNIVAALARATAPDGRIWVKVRLAVLPNGTTAWVPRAALGGYATVTTRLVIDRRRLTATLLRDGRRVLRAPIGIGTAAAPTPAGEFYVRNRLTRFRSPFYGPVALGTSARSEALTDWPGGGFVGIHGTNRPDLIPGRVSHGCIRMRNADIRRLARRMPIGTAIDIH
jgi:lipoprotein-anchoring transpeptidase ErfK/SrfK